MNTCDPRNGRRAMLFNRMKKASSKHRAKKRETIKERWYQWADRCCPMFVKGK